MPGLRTLGRSDLADCPFERFTRWFDRALADGLPEPTAMTLATVDEDGRPAARMVLLKGHDHSGLCFASNVDSDKGAQLRHNPEAALVVWWHRQQRQVRVEGRVAPAAEAESDAAFAARPRASRIGAWASPQSRPLSDRDELDRRLQEIEARFPDEIPRPPFWGLYRLVPRRFEFWQGRPDRLHDRFRYDRGAGDRWIIRRLAP